MSNSKIPKDVELINRLKILMGQSTEANSVVLESFVSGSFHGLLIAWPHNKGYILRADWPINKKSAAELAENFGALGVPNVAKMCLEIDKIIHYFNNRS